MVEFTLGLLVFITVLLFGIHFAEVGWLSAKVHEASASAIWDSTAYRTYQMGGWGSSATFAAPSAEASAQFRYSDWDGRTSAPSRSAPNLVLTRAQPMQVNCRKDGAVNYPLSAYAPPFQEPGAVSCSAQGDFGIVKFPSRFAEGSASGFFSAQNNARGGSATTLCSAGRALSGACGGRLTVLLGDNALTTGTDSLECELSGVSPSSCSNSRFYDVTLRTFDKSMVLSAAWPSGWTGRPEAWTRNIVPGLMGGRITGFYMSFRGEESGFNEPVPNGGNWETSPMDADLPGTPYRGSFNLRRTCAGAGGYCFLGKFQCD